MRDQRKKVTLLKVEDKDLVRHGAIAYEDGYADAREYGQDGCWLPDHYSAYERERYLLGFKKGLRVYRVKQTPDYKGHSGYNTLADLGYGKQE